MSGAQGRSPDKCPDCRVSFPILEITASHPRCKKCELLTPLPLNSEQYKNIISWPQCAACSDSYRNMAPCDGLQACGEQQCQELVGARSASTRGSAPGAMMPNTFMDRSHELQVSLQDRMKLGGGSSGGTLLNTDVLQEREEHLKKGRKEATGIAVHWTCRREKTPGKVDSALGKGACNFSDSDTMTIVLAQILSHTNLTWSKAGNKELQMTEVSLRLAGNYTFDVGTSTMPLNEFMRHCYKKPEALAHYLLAPAKSRHSNGKSSAHRLELHLELWIHDDLYAKRCEGSSAGASSTIKSMVSKARRPREPSDSDSMSSKQRRIELGSSFRSEFTPGTRRASTMVIQKSTEAKFRKILSLWDSNTAECELSETAEIEGQLADLHTAHGSMKLVHRLSIDSQLYTAKRFFRLSEKASPNPPSPPSIDGFTLKEHNEEIKAECIRSTLATVFLHAFYKHVEEQGEMGGVYKNLQIAETFLALENGWAPTPASGMALFENGEDEERAMMWLVERYRPSSVLVVQKFSGTKRHTTPNADLLSLTIYAFAHFVYLWTSGVYVIADIQGTPGRVNNGDGLILFDLMTHTISGDSGVGDCGKEEIKQFLAQHECKDVCERLGLDIWVIPKAKKKKKTPAPPSRRSGRLSAGREPSPLEPTQEDEPVQGAEPDKKEAGIINTSED
ncbi:kinase-like domain-containing protein [Ephemerocybe angulata]|uniref:Kinase-like domain-containing protein n=1 Tax=Ephemerocybe angulata TaxID=980116 RepID=A0A8H6LV50_9AGAR|nr:kinase-like domain-containing protein [Tulosesus angulatus]